MPLAPVGQQIGALSANIAQLMGLMTKALMLQERGDELPDAEKRRANGFHAAIGKTKSRSRFGPPFDEDGLLNPQYKFGTGKLRGIANIGLTMPK